VFLPRLCIERPVLATVMSLALIVLGIVGYSRLPVRELPDIEFPIVSVSTVLPGASPEVVETEITEII
jgi:multidrug efflux pump